jgi:hypothetical protein
MLLSVTGARILFLGLRTWSFELINRFKELTLTYAYHNGQVV